MFDNYGSALSDAKRATANLYNAETPLTTNLWCTTQVELEGDMYYSTNKKRNTAIYEALAEHVKSLDKQSVEYFAEMDYLDKYYIARNLYFPSSLRQQAEVSKWFLGGSHVPVPVKDSLIQFWMKFVPNDYRVKSPEDIKCPKFDATTGVALAQSPEGDPSWVYSKKGPIWPSLQRGTLVWLDAIADAVPEEWLSKDIEDLIGVRNPTLEKLALERPVIRKESGPGKVRWARSSSANVYILGRMFIESIQSEGSWSEDVSYIGKASNTQFAALKAPAKDDWYVGTHGDDWIAWCPTCKRWHSGDWSNFDLRVAARLLLASYSALYQVIKHLLTDQEKKWFYALAFLAIRCPSLWLWDRDGSERLSIRATLGKVRSGSGDFIMHNNAMNSAVCKFLLRKVHAELSSMGRKIPCRSKLFWKLMQKYANIYFGWKIKPESQLTHPHGFVACRAVHTRDDSYMARPTNTSVLRNWSNPAYDPEEEPNNYLYWMVARFRELNKTMAWSTVGETMIDTVVEVAQDAGVQDPYGMDLDNRILGQTIQRVAGQYSQRAYLES